jgi:hypothetical protein
VQLRQQLMCDNICRSAGESDEATLLGEMW